MTIVNDFESFPFVHPPDKWVHFLQTPQTHVTYFDVRIYYVMVRAL